MAVDKELIDILACPVCKGDIRISGDEKFILCDKCSLKYEIRENIPIMLPDEAIPFDKQK